MGNKVDINSVIADIESAIAENGVRADVAEWIAEAESLAKTVTIAELNRLCDMHGSVPFIVDNEYMPHCFGCVKAGEHKSMWLFVKEIGGTYKIFVQCAGCKAKATENIPIRICGKESVVTTIAVYFEKRRTACTTGGRRPKRADTGTQHEHGACRLYGFTQTVRPHATVC